MNLLRENSRWHSPGFKPTTSRHRVAVTAHARTVCAASAPSPQLHAGSPRQVTHRRSFSSRARACLGARRLARQVLVPARAMHETCAARSCAEISFAPLARPGIAGASAAHELHSFRSLAARLCAHRRARWLGGGVPAFKPPPHPRSPGIAQPRKGAAKEARFSSIVRDGRSVHLNRVDVINILNILALPPLTSVSHA